MVFGEMESNNNMFDNKNMYEDNSDSYYMLNNYEDDANSMSINESLLELMDNNYNNELFNENLYSEIDNILNYNSLCQGLSDLSNFKSQPLEIQKNIMSIMSRKRKRNNQRTPI